MSKYLKIFILILGLMVPTLVIANPPQNTVQKADFETGKGEVEQWFREAFVKMDVKAMDEGLKFIPFAKAIAGFGAMIYIGILGWQMLNGETEFQIMPIIKVFMIGMIIIHWSAFVNLCGKPFEKLTAPIEAKFTLIQKATELKRYERYFLQSKVLDEAIKLKAKNKLDEEKMKGGEEKGGRLIDKAVEYIGDKASASFDVLVQPVIEFGIKLEFYLQKVLGDFIEFVSLVILRICVYFIFFMQKIWSYILIMVGPIAIGMALIPGFENSLYNWVAKFINVNLYLVVGYIVLNLGHLMIIAGYGMEIDRLKEIVDDTGALKSEPMLIYFIERAGFFKTLIFTVVGYGVTAVGMLMVPSIADSIVQAGGGQIMSKVRRAGSNIMNKGFQGAKMAGKALATKGSSLVKDVPKVLTSELGKRGK